jgi:hypothetical protein
MALLTAAGSLPRSTSNTRNVLTESSIEAEGACEILGAARSARSSTAEFGAPSMVGCDSLVTELFSGDSLPLSEVLTLLVDMLLAVNRPSLVLVPVEVVPSFDLDSVRINSSRRELFERL